MVLLFNGCCGAGFVGAGRSRHCRSRSLAAGRGAAGATVPLGAVGLAPQSADSKAAQVLCSSSSQPPCPVEWLDETAELLMRGGGRK